MDTEFEVQFHHRPDMHDESYFVAAGDLANFLMSRGIAAHIAANAGHGTQINFPRGGFVLVLVAS